MEAKKLEDKINPPTPMLLSLDEIILQDDLQSRAGKLNEDVVQEYMERFASLRGVKKIPDGMTEFILYDRTEMPHLSAVSPDQKTFWLVCGFHRYDALSRLRIGVKIPVEVHEGDIVDAQYLSMTANKGHGLRRSNADKRRAVRFALNHPWTYELSHVLIGEIVGVSDKTVASVKAELESEDTRLNEESKTTSEIPRLTKQAKKAKRVGKDGKARKVPSSRRSSESVPDSGADEFSGRSRRKSRLDKYFEPPPEMQGHQKTGKKTGKKTVAKAPEFISIQIPVPVSVADTILILRDALGIDTWSEIIETCS